MKHEKGQGGRSGRGRQKDDGKTVFSQLQDHLFESSISSTTKFDFYSDVTKAFADYCKSDSASFCVCEGSEYFHFCEAVRHPKRRGRINNLPIKCKVDIYHTKNAFQEFDQQVLIEELLQKRGRYRLPSLTKGGSFWVYDTRTPLTLRPTSNDRDKAVRLVFKEGYGSLVIIPIDLELKRIGLLILKSKKRGFFTKKKVLLCEGVAGSLGFALIHHLMKYKLGERLKELTCLYTISRLGEKRTMPLEKKMLKIVESLPPAWQYPEKASARIVIENSSFEANYKKKPLQTQKADIRVDGKLLGYVEVGYAEIKPELDEGPFLEEERRLLDTISKEIAIIIEQYHADEARGKLQGQLRHADRLATIGQLAAGIAHELNEPLGNILGFAQLMQRSGDLQGQNEKDLDKVVKASLQAREIIKKLMFFGRQMPPKKSRINPNKVIDDGLFFLRSRCIKAGIEMNLSLCREMPEITVDPGQINQVIVNLVVNALQAMPEGGTLSIKTSVKKDYISITVRDTGTGMSPEVLRQIFIPFFTTKEVDQGTGLGLPVAHGIITSHGGVINAESEEGKGSLFEVQLPIDPKKNTTAAKESDAVDEE